MHSQTVGLLPSSSCRLCGKRSIPCTPSLQSSAASLRRAVRRTLPRMLAVAQDRSPYAQQRPQERPLLPFQQQSLPQSLPFQEPAASVPVPAPSLPAPLARRNQYLPVSNQRIFLQLSQVMNLPIITRTSGKNLGRVVNMLVDPMRREVVSLDLEDTKKGKTPARSATVPLSSLRQIGDVVLVHDESATLMDDRMAKYGCIYLTGLEVRTRSGRFLGKVRDYYFSPDNGDISRIVFDNFGLTFLPVSFFDCFSIASSDILTIGRSEVIVTDEAEMRQRKESSGVFGIIPNLLKTVNSSAQVVTVDAYRSDSYLPQDYSYDQWMRDLRRWEQETGMTYEQYQRMEAQRGGQRPAPAALPPARNPSYLPAGNPTPTRQADYAQPQQPYYPPQSRQQAYPNYPNFPYPSQQDPRTRAPAQPGNLRSQEGPRQIPGQDFNMNTPGPGPSAGPQGFNPGPAPSPGQQGYSTLAGQGLPGTASQGYNPSNGMPGSQQQGYNPAPGPSGAQQGYYGAPPGPGQSYQQLQPQQQQQQQQQPQRQQQQQQRQQAPPSDNSRRVDQWIDRDTRPSMDAVLSGSAVIGSNDAAQGTIPPDAWSPAGGKPAGTPRGNNSKTGADGYRQGAGQDGAQAGGTDK